MYYTYWYKRYWRANMDMNQESLSNDNDSTIMEAYQAAFFNLPGMAYLLDAHCALIGCNQHLLDFLSLTSIEEKTPGSLYKLMLKSGLWSESQIQNIKTKDIELILTENPTIDEQALQMIDAHDAIQQFQITRIPLFNKNKTVIALLVILHDLTKQKHLEEQVEKMKAQLQQFNARTESTISITKVAPEQTHSQPQTPTHALNILIVEDNVVAQKAAQSIMMQLDCNVDIASTEAQLLSIFTPGKYDIIFMDISLEETSGYLLSRKIRELEKDTEHHAIIIALTGYKADMLATDCGYYQIEGAITKPLTIEQARQIIQRYLLHIDITVKDLKPATPPEAS